MLFFKFLHRCFSIFIRRSWLDNNRHWHWLVLSPIRWEITFFQLRHVLVDFCVKCVQNFRRFLYLLFFTFHHHCCLIFIRHSRLYNNRHWYWLCLRRSSEIIPSDLTIFPNTSCFAQYRHRYWLSFNRFVEINRSDITFFQFIMF